MEDGPRAAGMATSTMTVWSASEVRDAVLSLGSDLWPVLQDVACECGEEGGHAQRPACTERRSEANADNAGRAGRVQERR